MQFQEEQDYTKRFDMSLWKKLVGYAKPFHLHLLFIMLLMLISAYCDVQIPMLTKEAIDTYIAPIGEAASVAASDRLANFGSFALRYSLVIVVQVICIFSFCFTSGKVEVGMTHRIRKIGFRRLQELSFSYYDKTPVGYMIARMTNDTQRLGDTIGWGLIDLMWGAGYVVMAAYKMLVLNWVLGLAVLAVIPIIAVVSMYFQKRILKSYREVRKTNSKITGAFNEGIMGAKTTKTLVREEANGEEFVSLTGTMKKNSIRAALLSALLYPIVMSLGSVAIAYTLWRGGSAVFSEGVAIASTVITIGTLTAFVNFASNIFEPIIGIARTFADLQNSQAAAERVITMIETEPEIRDTQDVETRYGDNFNPKTENWEEIKGDIDFENVTFKYSGGEKVLNDFSLHVDAGQTIALVGETGSGKSTIVNLICRFYEPTEGRILIDGVDYRERSQLWLQSHLGYVLQQPHLFSGTIRDNIRYGRLDATDEDVERVAKLVDAEDFILKFEKGYDTDVGEGGNRLSTGQKQLISFARALIANPAIFVLDEATSSVDTETEQKIQKAIVTSLKGRTSFIIAHRLSTIRTADRILVIQKGVVTESGTHKELIQKRGYYYNLYANQFKEEREQMVLGIR